MYDVINRNEMDDVLTLLGALGGFKAIEWIVTFFVNRKTNARKEDASADSMEIQNLLNIINNLTQQIERSDNRTKERDAKVDYVYGELRKEQAAHLDTVNRLHSSELANKLAEVKRCDVRRCPDRQPPGEF